MSFGYNKLCIDSTSYSYAISASANYNKQLKTLKIASDANQISLLLTTAC